MAVLLRLNNKLYTRIYHNYVYVYNPVDDQILEMKYREWNSIVSLYQNGCNEFKRLSKEDEQLLIANSILEIL